MKFTIAPINAVFINDLSVGDFFIRRDELLDESRLKRKALTQYFYLDGGNSFDFEKLEGIPLLKVNVEITCEIAL